MDIQKRILTFVTRSNWILFLVASILGFMLLPTDFAKGVLFGGLLVTVNFHLLAGTLRKALTPPHLAILIKIDPIPLYPAFHHSSIPLGAKPLT